MKRHSRYKSHKLRQRLKFGWVIKELNKIGIRVGDIFETCGYHPARCTRISYYHDDIVGESLITGRSCSCSIYHCGVVKLTSDQVQQRLDAHAAEGELGLMKLKGWSEKDAEDFMKTWR